MRKILRVLGRVISAPFRFIFWLLPSLYRGIRHFLTSFVAFFITEEEDTPLPDALAKTLENPVGLLYHLNELRKHLFRSALYLAIATVFSFIFITQILEFLSRPLPGGIQSLQAVDVTEPIGTVFKVALLSGFALSFPLIAFEIWWFTAPGLKRGERISSLLAIPIATLFFIGGMAFAYYLMLPVTLPILLNFMGLSTLPRPNSYFPFVTNLLFWLGMSFEFPVVIFIMARLGMVRAKMLQDQWRLAIVLIAVLAAAITTTTDPTNMALVMGPMFLLYILSIGLAYVAEKRRPQN